MNYKYTTFAVLSTLLIIYLSSLPEYSILGRDSVAEQIVSNAVHIPAYAVLSFLWLRSFEIREGQQIDKRRNGFVFIALVFFAISDEIHQSFVPGRIASMFDVGLDVLGIGMGLAVYKILRLNAGGINR